MNTLKSGKYTTEQIATILGKSIGYVSSLVRGSDFEKVLNDTLGTDFKITSTMGKNQTGSKKRFFNVIEKQQNQEIVMEEPIDIQAAIQAVLSGVANVSDSEREQLISALASQKDKEARAKIIKAANSSGLGSVFDFVDRAYVLFRPKPQLVQLLKDKIENVPGGYGVKLTKKVLDANGNETGGTHDFDWDIGGKVGLPQMFRQVMIDAVENFPTSLKAQKEYVHEHLIKDLVVKITRLQK